VTSPGKFWRKKEVKAVNSDVDNGIKKESGPWLYPEQDVRWREERPSRAEQVGELAVQVRPNRKSGHHQRYIKKIERKTLCHSALIGPVFLYQA
jgi:hypothetical protein